jgi:formate dehydrogenase subunit gamma
MRCNRAVIIASLALMLALVALGGSVLQFTLAVGEALAQSSVRPPKDAVNVLSPAETVLPGGSVRPPANATIAVPTEPGMPRGGEMQPSAAAEPDRGPLGTLGMNSDSDIWGFLRQGGEATVSIPDRNAAVLVQDDGMRWLEWRARGGPLQVWGGYGMLGMLGLLLLFYLIRGRVRIASGRSGVTIERFKGYERFAHWLLAVSFILLALSGLNLLYGRDWILPLVGKEAFATVTLAGKWLHNNVAWAFMLALVMIFVLWVAHNLPSRHDLSWIVQGGGIIGRKHPKAKKFNAGQKLVFWAVVLLGISVSLSGISLLFPYEAPIFAKSFAIMNDLGVSELAWGGPLPADLTGVQEMQYAQIWHVIVAFAMIIIVLAHIYIGTIGMEGAFAAMGSGQVDRNWAEEHHALWVEEREARHRSAPSAAAATPAE